jgi:hypothetical protein
MPVEMIIDHWNPSRRHYRTETFCYGPRSCPLYRAGPSRCSGICPFDFWKLHDDQRNQYCEKYFFIGIPPLLGARLCRIPHSVAG